MLARNPFSFDFPTIADPPLTFQLVVERVLGNTLELVLVELLEMHLEDLHNVVREVSDMGNASETVLIVSHQSVANVFAQPVPRRDLVDFVLNSAFDDHRIFSILIFSVNFGHSGWEVIHQADLLRDQSQSIFNSRLVEVVCSLLSGFVQQIFVAFVAPELNKNLFSQLSRIFVGFSFFVCRNFQFLSRFHLPVQL